MKQILGVVLILGGIALGLFAFKDRYNWWTQGIDQKVQFLTSQSIAGLIARNLATSKVRRVKVEVHSATLNFLLKGRTLDLIYNSKAIFDVEVDIFDIVNDEKLVGFVEQASLVNTVTKNKEAEFSDNLNLEQIFETQTLSGNRLWIKNEKKNDAKVEKK